MSDHLGDIAAKSLNTAAVVHPRPVCLFEPVHAAGRSGDEYRRQDLAVEELSEPEQSETAETRALPSARRQTRGHQPQANSVIDPFKGPRSISPESPPRREADRVPQSLDLREDKTAARTPLQSTGPHREFVQDNPSTVKLVSPEQQPRARVKPSIERAASDFPEIPISQRSGPPSFRTGQMISTQQSPGSTIHVTIGRIEVRAATPPVASPKQRAAPKTMSLDEYLGKRNGDGR